MTHTLTRQWMFGAKMQRDNGIALESFVVEVTFQSQHLTENGLIIEPSELEQITNLIRELFVNRILNHLVSTPLTIHTLTKMLYVMIFNMVNDPEGAEYQLPDGTIFSGNMNLPDQTGLHKVRVMVGHNTWAEYR